MGAFVTIWLQNGSFGYEDGYKRVIIPLLKGLSALHTHGVIHRDIKPENLFLGNNNSFLIGDCGLAVFANRAARTKTGLIVGTPAYMAPERLNCADGFEPTIDIFSAGMVILETLTGRLPGTETNKNFSLVHLTRELSGKELLSTGIPQALVNPIARSLKVQPFGTIRISRIFPEGSSTSLF